MKKYFSYLFLGILIFTLLSCGGSEDSSEIEDLQRQVDELQSQLDNEGENDASTSTSKKPSSNLKINSDDDGNLDIQGTIIEDSKYDPFFRYIDVQNLRIFVLDGVNEEIILKISSTYENMLQDNSSIDPNMRQNLLNVLKERYVYQRVGYVGPEYYDEPPCCPKITEELGDDAGDFAHSQIDYIWEKDSDEYDSQINEVIEHLLHTLTDQGFRFAFPEEWNWKDPNSTVNMAMYEAIEKGHYNITGYEEIKNLDPEGFNRVIATEFAYWMILASWDMFETAGMEANDEWNIDSSEELRKNLPISYDLYKNTVETVLSPPDQQYILDLYYGDISIKANTKQDHTEWDDEHHEDHHHEEDSEFNAEYELEPGESTGDPMKDEIEMFKRAISENTGPGCNVWSDVPCPEFPNFVKTQPSKSKLPIYDESTCEGSFNDREYELKTPKDDYVRCLIDASRSYAEPYFVLGAELNPAVKAQILEAEKYGAEIFGNWGPILNTLVRYGEPDVEYVAAQTCLYTEKYGSSKYEPCYEYNLNYYKTFDYCCGALHGTPEPLAPVRFQTFTYSAPETAYKEDMLRKVTLHEYVHVWQSAFKVHPHSTRCSDEQNVLCELGNGPLWLEEGVAEYFAVFYADKKGWTDYRSTMIENLNGAQEVYDQWGFTLRNSHDRAAKDTLDQHECGCGGTIMYNMGMWGAAWLINKAETNNGFIEEFYPNVAYIGYQEAFKNGFGISLDEFYDEFDEWLDSTPKSEKIKILDTISMY